MRFALTMGLTAASFMAAACVAATQTGTGQMTNASEAPLQDDALRALLVDAYFSRNVGGFDGPGEFFHANGVYQRDGGHGAIVAEGLFEIHDNAVCVSGDTLPRVCRRIVANGDGSYTFVNTADGHSVVMSNLRQR